MNDGSSRTPTTDALQPARCKEEEKQSDLILNANIQQEREREKQRTHLRVVLLQERQHPHVIPPSHSMANRVAVERLRVR
jgi:hypothetical protein